MFFYDQRVGAAMSVTLNGVNDTFYRSRCRLLSNFQTE